MKKRKDLSQGQLYESIYAPVQTLERNVDKEDRKLRKELHGYEGRVRDCVSRSWKFLFSHFGEEWIFLAVLGVLVALISYMIDRGALMCNLCRGFLYRELATHPWAKYFAWVSLPVTLVMFSAGFCKLVEPKTVGSGIPEIKTILRGVYIKNFLTFKALVAKVVGITSTIGSGMPLGKEGPLIHISSCLATLLGRIVGFQTIYANESRKVEMLAAAAAVGVGCTFGAPIGGVLLSVEITTSYYGVRNYWRSFCASIWGATVYRLLLVWIEGVESVTVVFRTNFFIETPWAAQELFAFSILGIVCGLGGAFYMRMRIKFGKFVKNSKAINQIKAANFFIYPGFIALVVSSISFPLGIGQFMAAQIPYGAQVINLFSNYTWTGDHLNAAQVDVIRNWHTKYTGIYLHLLCFIGYNFICSILASSMPIPNGSFIPTFRMGAATGRIMGELMHTWYPQGLSYYGRVTRIIPGGYAIVGAAAFSGAVTQTMSVCVIILEMTGQMSHTIPILIAVLISNGIAQCLGPSVYNSVIKAKNLPYLPDILPSNSAIYNIYVEDFMVTDVKYIHHGMSLEQLKHVLSKHKFTSFPLVNNPVRMILLGSIPRLSLIELIESHVGTKRQLHELTNQEVTVLETTPPSDLDEGLVENPTYQYVLTGRRVCDLSPRMKQRWRHEQMKLEIDDFSICQIDPAPFQLVERTSLLKVHTMFSMVGINTAYVTSLGRLIGVVGLKELHKAIEDAKSGTLRPHNIDIVVTSEECRT